MSPSVLVLVEHVKFPCYQARCTWDWQKSSEERTEE